MRAGTTQESLRTASSRATGHEGGGPGPRWKAVGGDSRASPETGSLDHKATSILRAVPAARRTKVHMANHFATGNWRVRCERTPPKPATTSSSLLPRVGGTCERIGVECTLRAIISRSSSATSSPESRSGCGSASKTTIPNGASYLRSGQQTDREYQPPMLAVNGDQVDGVEPDALRQECLQLRGGKRAPSRPPRTTWHSFERSHSGATTSRASSGKKSNLALLRRSRSSGSL